MKTLLIVEDDEALRSLCRYWVGKSPTLKVVGEAADGLDAITRAQQLRPDLILLDLLMPRMGGIEALPHLRRVSPKSRIMVVTMLQEPGLEKKVKALGADMFMDKDTEPDILVRRLVELSGEAPPARS